MALCIFRKPILYVRSIHFRKTPASKRFLLNLGQPWPEWPITVASLSVCRAGHARSDADARRGNRGSSYRSRSERQAAPTLPRLHPGRFWTVGTHASRHWRGRVDRRYGQSMLCRDLAKSVQARGTAFLRNDLPRARGDGEPDQRIAPRFVHRPHLRDNHERQPGTPAVLPP